MRPGVILILVSALAAPPAPAQGDADERRWVAYVRAGPDGSVGSLEAVRSNGQGARTLIEAGISEADLGRRNVAYAVRHRDGGPPELLRVTLRRREPSPVEAGPPDVSISGIAASAEGDIAYQRLVPRRIDAPEHLTGTPKRLARVRLPVLVPPERPLETTGTVVEATRPLYRVLFTNDPKRQLAHAEQINRFVVGSRTPPAPPLLPVTVPVRGTEGAFSCGASACFLDWEEQGVWYSVGEFGNPVDAAAFAESLVLMDELLGPTWRAGLEFGVPELVVKPAAGRERVLESAEELCECDFRPVDWSPGGERLLVILALETFTALQEYDAGGGEPAALLEGDLDEPVLDAAYGPGEVLVLVGGAEGPAGTLQGIDGGAIADGVLAFDVAGSTLAYVRTDGDVVVRDLESGDERTVGEGAVGVSVSPELLAEPPASPSPTATPPPSGGFPALLASLLAAAAATLIGGTALVLRARRGR